MNSKPEKEDCQKHKPCNSCPFTDYPDSCCERQEGYNQAIEQYDKYHKQIVNKKDEEIEKLKKMLEVWNSIDRKQMIKDMEFKQKASVEALEGIIESKAMEWYPYGDRLPIPKQCNLLAQALHNYLTKEE